MDKATSILSHQIFGPTQRTAEGRVKSSAEGIVEKLRIYYWPKGVKDTDKLGFLAFFTAHGKSEDISPSSWATWVFSYIVLCFPEMQEPITSLNSREYFFEPLPKRYIEQVLALRDAAENYSDSQPAEYGRYIHDLHIPADLPAVELSEEFFPPDLASCALLTPVYGFCSLLIYLSAKKITEKNAIAITKKRPQNVIDSYKIDDLAVYFLTGEGKMGTTAHEFVNQVWTTYMHARVAIVSEVAAFTNGQTLAQRVVYTITKLIEHAGMQPAYFIHKFLQARPECASFSCMRPSINAYISSVREVAAAPSHLQPYYKLIHGESTRAFHRNTILPLSACAIAHEKALSSSMGNFDLGEGATSAVMMYDAEAAIKGYPTLAGLNHRSDKEEDIQ
jgi:hypothetical protein